MIEAEGLGRGYGEVQALESLDLSVPEGTVCALLGPNGAGKTTAIRILATLLAPDTGTARICGYDVATQGAQVRRRIGLAGQHAAVDEALTGRDNLFILGLMHHLGRRAARARAAELLQRFDLEAAADRPVKGWSGGMRRRLDLIASLIAEPPVLFLDEPTTGLDPHSRDEIHSAVAELTRSGTTVLLTTQYLEEADRLADNLMVIDSGREIAQGTPEELKDLIGARVEVVLPSDEQISQAEQALTALGGDDVAVQEHRVSATVKAGSLTLPELVRHLDELGITLQDTGIRRPTLDEVFLNLTRSTR
ncbi:ATP-binding cassette domain-containing protein [Kineosporia babensis]|uniref:ATP-binding cassette domain-containing protein n=1 Tax=Kineosporia babensis TaxID=499548 RepID=A0A9X1N8S9_9ACTN|nr:ATP-binding cassette domain-containing protein [Kineosporia babensis]